MRFARAYKSLETARFRRRESDTAHAVKTPEEINIIGKTPYSKPNNVCFHPSSMSTSTAMIAGIGSNESQTGIQVGVIVAPISKLTTARDQCDG
jgi:hypothetical protein